jgi:hypothetical protein
MLFCCHFMHGSLTTKLTFKKKPTSTYNLECKTYVTEESQRKLRINVSDLHYYKIENGLNNDVYTYKRYTIYFICFL